MAKTWALILLAAVAGCNNSQLVAIPGEPTPVSTATPGSTPTPITATPTPSGSPSPLPSVAPVTPTPTPSIGGSDPVAIIQYAEPVQTGAAAYFDGSLSYSPIGLAIVGFSWSMISVPSGSQSALSGASSSVASLPIDLAGDYIISLTVTDAHGAQGSSQVTFSALPSTGMLDIELAWPAQYGQVDMDLHLVNLNHAGAGMWDMEWDCFYDDCQWPEYLAWNGSSQPGVGSGDPWLNFDNITSHLPEQIQIQSPLDGQYAVCVHYFATHTANGQDIPTNDELTITSGGTQLLDKNNTLTTAGQVWYAANLSCVGGTCSATADGQMGTTTDEITGQGVCGF